MTTNEVDDPDPVLLADYRHLMSLRVAGLEQRTCERLNRTHQVMNQAEILLARIRTHRPVAEPDSMERHGSRSL